MAEGATRSGRRRMDRPSGGIDAFDALSVRFEVGPGEVDAVQRALRRWAEDHRDGDVRDLVPAEDVNLSTVFFDDDPSNPAIVWYVEVLDDGAPAWQDPVATLGQSPAFEALSGTLTGETTVQADGVDGQQLMVNASHPDRQSWYEEAGCEPILAPVAGDEVPIEVATVAIPLRAGGG